jgi:GTP cyclohydrolase I
MNRKRIERLTEEFLVEIGLDPHSERLKKTPARVAEMLTEIFSHRSKNLKEEISIFRTDVKNKTIIIKNIPFYSFCEHHILPFFGSVYIAYIPKDGAIAGFSSFVSIVNHVSMKLQLQENLTDEIADEIVNLLKPEGVIVLVKARHLCIEMRGEKATTAEIDTYSARGKMKEDSFRKEAINMMTD